MRLQDAITSGLKFKRKGDSIWHGPNYIDTTLYAADVLANDWEVELDIPDNVRSIYGRKIQQEQGKAS